MTPLKILVCHPGASFSVSDVFTGLASALRAQGHTIYEYALDQRIERSSRWLQYCWVKGGKKVTKPNNADKIYHASEGLVSRALRVQPDVVLIVSAMFLHPDIVVLLRRAGIKIAILFTESPYDDEKQTRLLPYADVAWTNERISAEQMGIHYLAHARNAEVHDPKKVALEDVASHDVVFVGTGFEERIDLLAGVDWSGIDLGLYGTWALLGPRHHLRQYIKGGCTDNQKTAALYLRAKVGLNLFRSSKGFGKGAPKVTGAQSLNPRAYELAALGCFTLSEYRPEVPALFGDLVPTFTTSAELQALLESWLRNDLGRARIAARLPETVAAHTWDVRARQIVSDLGDAGIVARRSSDPAGMARAVGG